MNILAAFATNRLLSDDEKQQLRTIMNQMAQQQALIRELLAALRIAEWGGDAKKMQSEGWCSTCTAQEGEEHEDDCAIGLAIKHAEAYLAGTKSVAPMADRDWPKWYETASDEECCETGYHRRKEGEACACGYKPGRPHTPTSEAYMRGERNAE